MGYEAVIFDLDGTLVHTSMDYIYNVVGQTLNNLGTASSNDAIDLFWFKSGRDKIIRENFGLDTELFWTTFRKYDTPERRRQFTRAYDDIGFIKELRQKGYKTGIVTAAATDIASLEIGMLGEVDFDSIIIAQASNGIKPKPHPHGLESCLDIMDVDNYKSLYVGNAKEDVEAAKNAKVFDVLLLREDKEYEFTDINPSLIIHSLYELREFLGF